MVLKCDLHEALIDPQTLLNGEYFVSNQLVHQNIVHFPTKPSGQTRMSRICLSHPPFLGTAPSKPQVPQVREEKCNEQTTRKWHMRISGLRTKQIF